MVVTRKYLFQSPANIYFLTGTCRISPDATFGSFWYMLQASNNSGNTSVSLATAPCPHTRLIKMLQLENRSYSMAPLSGISTRRQAINRQVLVHPPLVLGSWL